jgi:hypothetical protein
MPGMSSKENIPLVELKKKQSNRDNLLNRKTFSFSSKGLDLFVTSCCTPRVKVLEKTKFTILLEKIKKAHEFVA